MRNGQFSSSGGMLVNYRGTTVRFKNLGSQNINITDNQPFSPLFTLVFGYFCPKVQLVEKKNKFLAKMVDLCTKIPNFKAKYLQKSPEIA